MARCGCNGDHSYPADAGRQRDLSMQLCCSKGYVPSGPMVHGCCLSQWLLRSLSMLDLDASLPAPVEVGSGWK